MSSPAGRACRRSPAWSLGENRASPSRESEPAGGAWCQSEARPRQHLPRSRRPPRVHRRRPSALLGSARTRSSRAIGGIARSSAATPFWRSLRGSPWRLTVAGSLSGGLLGRIVDGPPGALTDVLDSRARARFELADRPTGRADLFRRCAHLLGQLPDDIGVVV